MNRNFNNSQDSNANLKSELNNAKTVKSSLESKIKNFEDKMKKMQLKNCKKKNSVEVQTFSTVDTPHLITDPLPPIFGSQLCKKSKSVFLYKSLPDLSFLSWVSFTEDDLLRDQAEKALNWLYDREIENFYLDARERAAQAQDCNYVCSDSTG